MAVKVGATVRETPVLVSKVETLPRLDVGRLPLFI